MYIYGKLGSLSIRIPSTPNVMPLKRVLTVAHTRIQ